MHLKNTMALFMFIFSFAAHAIPPVPPGAIYNSIERTDGVFVRFNDQIINILRLSNLEGSGLNALLQLKGACYQGDQINVVHTLNDIFNMTDRSRIASSWPVSFTQATTPNIAEQNAGLSDSIGIEYEVKAQNYSIVRFTINRCK